LSFSIDVYNFRTVTISQDQQQLTVVGLKIVHQTQDQIALVQTLIETLHSTLDYNIQVVSHVMPITVESKLIQKKKQKPFNLLSISLVEFKEDILRKFFRNIFVSSF
jgi:hypothetical protein